MCTDTVVALWLLFCHLPVSFSPAVRWGGKVSGVRVSAGPPPAAQRAARDRHETVAAVSSTDTDRRAQRVEGPECHTFYLSKNINNFGKYTSLHKPSCN